MAKILLIGDMVGYGRLAIGAQASVLHPMGHTVANLPTALVSNNFCYQKYAMLDTTDYMRQTIEAWRSLGFTFDYITVGFIASDEQASLLTDFCSEQRQRGALVVVDPIMADNGSLYSGLGEDMVERLRRIVSLADIAVPNYTEACLLTDAPFRGSGLKAEEVPSLVDGVRALGARSVVITSSRVDGHACVVGYSAWSQQYMQLPYREVPAQFHGTGDIFTALLLSKLIKGRTLEAATQITMEQLSALIDLHQDSESKSEGLPI